MVKSYDLADFLIFNSTIGLSNLELQALLNLIEFDFKNTFNESLFEDNLINFKSYIFKISEHVYWKYRNFGANTLPTPERVSLNLPKKYQQFIIERLEFYNQKSFWEWVSIIKNNQTKGLK